MTNHLALVRRDNGAIINRLEYEPFVQGDQERKTARLNSYRNDWYQNTSYFHDTILDIKEL